MKKPFAKGNKLASGGKREGAGAPKNEAVQAREKLSKQCRQGFFSRNLLNKLFDQAEGKDCEQKINENGEVLNIPPSIKDQREAIRIIMEYGFGKPDQVLDMGGNGGNEIVITVKNK